MKPIRSSLLLLCAAAILLPPAGCGGSGSDPQEVIDIALSRDSLLAAPIGDAQVEVASLGFEDAVLDRQLLEIDRDTNEVLREALAGSATDSSDEGGDRGLTAVIENLTAADAGDLDGVAVEKVTGSIDVNGLVDRIRPLSEEPGAGRSEVVPGIGELEQLESSLVAADFELFASEEDGSLERFDLILSLDDTENALPPSRIRFSLTRPESAAAGQ